MRTKRKMEEKKMSMSKNIARLAVTAGLTAALSFGGVMAPVSMAFADGTPVATTIGNVTIKDDDYAGTTFKGIKIFSATVTQDQTNTNVWDSTDEKTLSDIKWASDEVRDAVTGEFNSDTTDPSKPDNINDAAAWAKWIKTKTEAEYEAGTNQTTNLNVGTTLDRIAKALESKAWTDATSGTGTFTGIDAGYWLFETKSVGNTTGADGNIDAFTSPIFAVVGGEDVNVNPKKDVPKVTKAVKDDATGATFKKSADSRMDQFIEYQLTGTVASNINTYDEYYYEFEDKLPGSMSAELVDDSNEPNITVEINGYKVTSGYQATYEDNTLKVVFNNLKVCMCSNGPVTFSADTKVTVGYKAKLDPSKIFEGGVMKTDFNGLVGQPQKNKVTLTYSNNPHNTSSYGKTVEHLAYDYTYGIDVTKVGSDVDKSGNKPALAGVQFILQESGSKDYIKADGTLTPNKNDAILTTNSEGKINVVGLDEGTYVLKEVKPAPGYNNSAADGITFTITNNGLPTNDDSFNPGCRLAEGTDNKLVTVAETNTEKVDGKVHLTVTDQKGSNLPLTGLNGVTFTWIAGGAVLCIGVAHLIRSRKQAEESERE